MVVRGQPTKWDAWYGSGRWARSRQRSTSRSPFVVNPLAAKCAGVLEHDDGLRSGCSRRSFRRGRSRSPARLTYDERASIAEAVDNSRRGQWVMAGHSVSCRVTGAGRGVTQQFASSVLHPNPAG